MLSHPLWLTPSKSLRPLVYALSESVSGIFPDRSRKKQLPEGTQLPQSSQGFPMDVTGLRLVSMRLGEFVLEMEFWVCRSCRRTIISTGELLRKGLSCHFIGFNGTEDSREVSCGGFDLYSSMGHLYRMVQWPFVGVLGSGWHVLAMRPSPFAWHWQAHYLTGRPMGCSRPTGLRIQCAHVSICLVPSRSCASGHWWHRTRRCSCRWLQQKRRKPLFWHLLDHVLRGLRWVKVA